MYPTGGHQVITDTVMRSYASGQRETNVISGEDSSEKTTIDFDKIKGVAVDYSYEIQETSGDYTIVSTESLTNTNSDAWAVIPEFPSMAVFMALLIAIPIVLVAYKKKTLSNHKFVVLPKA